MVTAACITGQLGIDMRSALLRVMKLSQGIVALLYTILVFSFLVNVPSAIADGVSSKTNAPTGVYASLSAAPERFTVELQTNGIYTVLVTGLMSTNRQSGTWSWDGVKRQFSLKPNTNGGAFLYELRLLRLDPRQPDTLQWIPLQGIGSAGAIDYVRFKRKNEP